MALNIATFKTRALTAVIFVAVMLTGILWNHWSFFILFSIIHFGCWVEYQKLVCLIDPGYTSISPFHKYGVMIAGWCILLCFTDYPLAVFGIKLSALGWWLGIIAVVALPIMELLFSQQLELKNIGHSAFGLLYISLSLGMMVNLNFINSEMESGSFIFSDYILPLAVLGSLWINDTMAYLVGSFIGKTPFSKISPKKTWEGTIGGALLCVAVIALVSYKLKTTWQLGAIIGAIAAVFGTAGDLFESKLKRMAGVKDSGSIMPGHGGFLDRFDSLLFAAPALWILLYIFM